MAEGRTTEAGRTGVCRHCGALVGAGEGRCMMCGTPVARSAEPQPDPPRAPHADTETLGFLRAVISRPATFTFIFLIANVFLYLLMWHSGGATGDVLTAYGAKLNRLIDHEGQWWRFVTPIFLHVQLPGYGRFPVHLLTNMYGLFILGPLVEKLYGSAKFVVFWVVAGVAGVVASYLSVRSEWAYGAVGRLLFRPFDTPLAGASGALFGLMGVLLVFGLKYRRELPVDFKRALGIGLLPTLLINFFVGYMWPEYANNAAHFGGLVAGMVLGLAVGYKRPGAHSPVAYAWHAAQVACLLLVVVSFVMVARHFEAQQPPLSNVAGGAPSRSSVHPFREAVNAGQSALINFLRGDADGLAAAAERLEQAPAPSTESEALRGELKALVVRARATAEDKSLKPAEREERLRELTSDFVTWQERFSEWSKENKFGIGMQKADEPADEEK